MLSSPQPDWGTTIHADAYTRRRQTTGEVGGCELHTLVRVKDVGLALLKRFLQGVRAEPPI
jgi:hypothetical protein